MRKSILRKRFRAKGLESWWLVAQDPMGVPGGHRRSIEVRCLVILAPEAVGKL